MKDYSKLQNKLLQLLRNTSTPGLNLSPGLWGMLEFRQAVAEVQAFVDSQEDNLGVEELIDWVTEAKFFLASGTNRL